jgi:hypothetical protein
MNSLASAERSSAGDLVFGFFFEIHAPGEHLIGFIYLLELLLGEVSEGVSLMLVWVILGGEFSVGFDDIFFRCSAIDAQNFVIVFFHPVILHRSNILPGTLKILSVPVKKIKPACV